jgi:glycosyltransferase involved in cell wall biosynthesis
MSALVSVLIPAYNAEPWIGGTIRSCLAQTWPNVEVIVVDDGSRDATLDVARSFESSRVKVVTQPNSGAPVARNRAFELARGAFIQWLDADDLLHPEKIASQMRVAEKIADPSVLLSGQFGTFYRRPEKAIFERTSLWRDLTPLEYFLIRFNENACFQTDAWLVSRELTEAAGPWSDIGSPDDDGEYFCRVAVASSRIKFVEQARSYYRQGVGSGLHIASSAKSVNALFQSKVKCIRHLLALEDSPRTRAAAIQLLQEWMPYFYPEHQNVVTQAQELARNLGGELHRPRLKWKYRAFERLIGYSHAAKLSRSLPAFKSRIVCNWDGLLSTFSAREERTYH